MRTRDRARNGERKRGMGLDSEMQREARKGREREGKEEAGTLSLQHLKYKS